jgi:hypothetical protein
MDKNTMVIVVVVIIVAAVALILLFMPRNAGIVACTQEARLCPDGTSVGRTEPNCEFAPCPTGSNLCPKDTTVCPDGSTVSRTGPSCEFVCPTARVCAAGQYTSSDCDGACTASQECKQTVNAACYACASKVLNCYEWSMYPTEGECRSNCFYPKWCEYSNPGCWQCMTPYDIRQGLTKTI